MIEIVKSEFAAPATLKEGGKGWGVIQENGALADETFVPNGFIRSAGFDEHPGSNRHENIDDFVGNAFMHSAPFRVQTGWLNGKMPPNADKIPFYEFWRSSEATNRHIGRSLTVIIEGTDKHI